MGKLLVLNLILIIIIAFGLWCIKKHVKSERTKNIILIVASFLTILCHYSSLLYHQILDGGAMKYLSHNPNLILPIYPCNVVMWACIIYGVLKNKQSRFGAFLCDYVFWFDSFIFQP